MTLRVNGTEIPPEAIEYELSRLVQFYSHHLSDEEIEERMDTLREKARDQAIGSQLLMREARRRRIVVPEKEVDETVNRMREKAGGEERFVHILKKQGLQLDQLKRSIADGRRVDMLIAEVTAGTAEPAEEEIREFFDKNSERYSRPERARAQHILVAPQSPSPEHHEEARKKLMGIRSEHEKGADFGDLAAAHSECPSGKKSGGSLGWVTRGMMVPEFEEALFAAEVGKVTDLVKTQFGYHILLKNAHEDEAPASFEEARAEIADLLRHNARGRKLAEYVESLKATASIVDE